jgi:5-methylcytosine-specific restriction enzyme subunit McrC
MRRLTFRERDALPVGQLDGLTEPEAAAFARLQPTLPFGALTWEHRAIRFGPFCGVLRAGGVMVELLPKTDDGLDPDDGARGLLVAMLRTTGTLTVFKAGEALLGQQRMHLLDHFILDFCARVNAALRGGAIAHYQEHTENLYALRGRLRLTEHLRKNAFDRSHLFCSFDERTIDNPHNRALKGVLSNLLSQTISSHAKATVAALLHRFDEVAHVSVSPKEIERLPFDRMIRRWEPVFERARWLLQGLFPDVRIGEVGGACLLFNMERLFEAFIGKRIRRAWHESPPGRFRVELQGPQDSLAQSVSGPAFALRPDITILEDGRVIGILDAKWKKLDSSKPNSGVSPSDAYQLTAYASRYGCNRIGLIYPAARGSPGGLVDSFRLRIPGAPTLDIHAVDLRALGFGSPLPDDLLPSEIMPSGFHPTSEAAVAGR